MQGLRRKVLIGVISAVIVIIIIIAAVSWGRARWAEQEHQAMLNKYPLRYDDLIEKYAQEYGLEQPFIAAIIYCESTFNPDAVSSDDARGLMQVLPSTGEWISGKFGEQGSYNPDILFDPETNIRYACWYLDYLDDRFSGDIVKVIAAYHGGQGTVDKWLDDPEISADGKNLTSIPPGQTANYVEKVQSVREIYIDLYYAGREGA